MSVLVDPVTPRLWRACLAGDTSLMDQEMVTRRADPHVVDRNGETCLHMAARSGQAKAVERLLDEGLSMDQANQNGQTPLHVAVNLELINIVRTIIQHGGNLNAITKFSGNTALHTACRRGQEEMVKLLLDCGANCAIKDKIKEWADFYTNNQTILDIFDKHFEVCTHGRGKGQQNHESNMTYTSSPYNNGGSTQIEHNVSQGEEKKKKKKSKKKGKSEGEERDGERVVAGDDDDDDNTKDRSYRQRERDDPSFGNIQHGDVELFNENNEYDPDREALDEGQLRRNDKKLKINHKMEFSDQHRKRMQQNVFDRLMGGAAKKKEENN